MDWTFCTSNYGDDIRICMMVFRRCFGRRVFRYRMANTASETKIADPRIIDQGGKSEISNSEITGKGSNRTEPKGKKQKNIREEVFSKTQARSELD